MKLCLIIIKIIFLFVKQKILNIGFLYIKTLRIVYVCQKQIYIKGTEIEFKNTKIFCYFQKLSGAIFISHFFIKIV